MGKFNLAICVLLILVLASARNADAQLIPVDERGKAIQDYVDQVHQKLGFSGVVLAAREGKIIATAAVGPSNLKPEGDPLTKRTVFEIASCTKPFTAIAIMQLAEEKKLSLDDSISKHLPNVPQHSQAITIRQLLSHTSGIPGINSEGSGDKFDEVLPTFLAGGPQHPPGTHYEYWNQGYSILSEVIARASGKSYTDYIRENIFKPCDMKNSCFTGDPPPPAAKVAVGVSSFGEPRSALEHPYGSYGYQYRGMGGLVTNIEDLWHWDRALRNGKLLQPEFFKEMITAGQVNGGAYGLGWSLARDPGGHPSHRHSGSVRGFQAEVRRYPSIDGVVFVLSNQDESLPTSLVATGVEQILFGNKFDDGTPALPTQDLADAAEGTYEDARKRRLTIAKSPGLRAMTIDWGGPMTKGYLGLDAQGNPHLYMPDYASGQIQFTDQGRLKFSGTPKRKSTVSLLIPNSELVFRRHQE